MKARRWHTLLMHHLRAFGLLGLSLLLLTVVWDGYGRLDSALAAPGAVCLVDGVTPVPTVYPAASAASFDRANAVSLAAGAGGYCRLSPDALAELLAMAWWHVDGMAYPAGYNADLRGQNFPPLEWDWPIRLTWGADNRTLASAGWAGRILERILPLMPFVSIAAMIALVAREYVPSGAGAEEDYR